MYLFFFPLLFLITSGISVSIPENDLSQIASRTRALSLLFSSLQCPLESIASSPILSSIQSTFSPILNLNLYKNSSEVFILIDHILKSTSISKDNPFTNADIPTFQKSLDVIFHNANDFNLFYNTSAWLLNKVNSAQLYWALMVTLPEKFPEIITPSAVDVFPQHFIDKKQVLKAANLQIPDEPQDQNPVGYYRLDPGLNEFHLRWHIINPFWWDHARYGVERYQRGELFLYMHHQLISRYEAELMSNSISGFGPLELDPNFKIPEGFIPDVLNINYLPFFTRQDNEKLKSFDFDDQAFLKQLISMFNKLKTGVQQDFLLREDGSHESLLFNNGSDILGYTVEPVSVHSVNLEYYGSFHNFLHRFLAAMVKVRVEGIPGVEAYVSISLRDPLFYRLHKLVDSLYLELKEKLEPYTEKDLDFPGIEIKSFEVVSEYNELNGNCSGGIPTLATYFDWATYDISAAARPCNGIGEDGTTAQVQILNHYPFHYEIKIKSNRKKVSYGMVRIFLLPEYTPDGSRFDMETSHVRAIELDRFRVELDGREETVIKRSSYESTVIGGGQQPGLKDLLHLNKLGADYLLNNKVGCGYPANLLIPKGTEEGLGYRINIMISEEEKWDGEIPENFPYCGVLRGKRFPDRRPMGFPFDRKGTKFINVGQPDSNPGRGYTLKHTPKGGKGELLYKNVKEVSVIIKHSDY